jgi:hypothetical protein
MRWHLRRNTPVTKFLTLSTLLALAACAPAAPAGSAATLSDGSITADVGLSEWVPPGEVSLDLRTGDYRLRPAPPRQAPANTAVAVRRGTLAAAQLGAVRGAVAAAVSQGMVEPACEAGGRPPRVVISNAPTPAMVLTSEGRTLTAHRDRGCWTDAAGALHAILETTFAPE